MHIFNNIKNFLYDNDNFIAYFNNNIFIYNIVKIDCLTNTNIVLFFNNKKIQIIGKDLKVKKCINKEILINGSIESVNLYER